MLLTEYEGKQLLASALPAPSGFLVTKNDWQQATFSNLKWPVMAKAQVFHGNRGLSGLIQKAENEAELHSMLSTMFAKTDQNGQAINQILIESTIPFEAEQYLALTYDTKERALVANYSSEGGMGMDERGQTIQSLQLSISESLAEFTPQPGLTEIVNKLTQIFLTADATLIEINPLVELNGEWLCLDAKVELDDVAAFRHPEWENYPQRTAFGRPPTQREQQAHQVSQSDHRGVAGESFFEFEGGEVGVLAAGGGASILAMDALLAAGIKPANYTEHSGNPPREKVKAITDVILSIPNLKGLFVVGTNANFTDIFETLAGVIDSLLESKYSQGKFALLIRRGGPRWEEAFSMIKERLSQTPIKIKLLGPDFPIVNTASEMKALLEESA